MCGIAGQYNIAPRPADSALLRRMLDRLAHRGPDAEGLWVAGSVGLGHRRLAIIDRSVAANQPMLDAQQRYVLTYNGELYNYRALRAALPNYPFQTQSDTEVILAAYAQWGQAFLSRLNGMFALALFDRHTGQLLLARDRLGEKPLYYHHLAGQLLFASEIRALLVTQQVPRQLAANALGLYLRYQTVPAPDTLVAGIHQLPAGCIALVNGSNFSITPYWSIVNPEKITPPPNRQIAAMEVRSRLQQAVATRMVSDVPVGAFLSGGMDSGAVVGLMAQVSTEPVNTFTLAFAEAGFDESGPAAALARRFTTRHHTLSVSAADALAQLPAMLASLDTPGADGLNTFIVAKWAKEAGISVVLSGLGGDELFGGYSSFARYRWLQRYGWLWQLPPALRLTLAPLARLTQWPATKVADWLRLPHNTPEHVFPLFRQALPDTLVNQLLPQATPTDSLKTFFREQADALWQLPPMSQTTVGEWKTYAEPLLLRDADQMSMAHALELRTPFFDYTLVEYMLQLPDDLKTGPFAKQLLANALPDILPARLARQPKMGFTLPWDSWLRGSLRSFAQERVTQLAQRGLLTPAVVNAVWKRFLAHDPAIRWNQIWLLVVLEDWLQQHDF